MFVDVQKTNCKEKREGLGLRAALNLCGQMRSVSRGDTKAENQYCVHYVAVWEGKAFQAEGIASGKSLRQEQSRVV